MTSFTRHTKSSQNVDLIQANKVIESGSGDKHEPLFDEGGLENDEDDASSHLLGTSHGSGTPNDTGTLSIVQEENDSPSTAISTVQREKAPQVTWSSLPRKGQLAILTFARLSEPFTQTSLTAYMFYLLKSFNPALPDSIIAGQGGMIQAAFPAAQLLTAVLWGRAADTDWIGRKRVLLIGLFGTCFSCLGFGFSKTFVQAMIYRVLGGALNGNIGVMRTMISEIIEEKKYAICQNCNRVGLIFP
jgi:Major Facilitator Superfamily